MPFIPGLELNAGFYRDVVAPLLAERPHAAGLLGDGSDVLGYDTARSTDHGWGPRLQVFVAEPDIPAVRQVVDAGLPETYQGWPVRYSWDDVPVGHHVVVTTAASWVHTEIGRDPRDGMSTMDWLLAPQQRLLGIVRGAVYADPYRELARIRGPLAWYPRDVWLWLLACQWTRIAQEEAFVGRAAEVGDALGSRLLAARLAREAMRLAFLLERTYWPYPKWFGTAFARLAIAPSLSPALDRAVAATEHPAREAALVSGYELLARRHNALGLTAPVDPSARRFYERPFRVLGAGRFADACLAEVADPWLRGRPLVGSVDQFADSTDVLSATDRARRLGAIYSAERSP